MRVRGRRGALLAFPVVLAALGTGPVASAAEDCTLIGTDEVDAAFGVDGTELASGGDSLCVFTGPASVYITVTPGADLARPKADRPDGESRDVAGDPAWSVAGAGALYVAADGALLSLRAALEDGTAVDDVEAALTELAELALARLPAGPADADLDRMRAFIPAEIDGVTLQVQTIGGDQLSAFLDPEDPEVKALTDALAAQGHALADITLMGAGPEDAAGDVGAAVILVPGADAGPLLEPIVKALLSQDTDAPMTTVELGGKEVTRIDGAPVLHAYAAGDVIAVVNGSDDFLEGYFAGLP